MTWDLTARTIDGASGTVVRVTQTGLSGSPDERIATALEATQGFTYVLADLKMFLETGTARGIVRDKALLIAAAAK